MGIWQFVWDKFHSEKRSCCVEVVRERHNLRLKHLYYPLNMNEFKPITQEALSYMDSLPSYEPLPRGSYFLPKDPCAYLLPLELIEGQWDYLETVFSEYKFIGGSIPRHLFKRLPGIEKVLFHSDIECLDPGVRFHMYPTPLRLNVWCMDDEPKRFDPKTMLVFESTILGAVTAFYLCYRFNHSCCPFLSKHRERDWFIDRTNFGEKIGGPIQVPYGFRIEILNEKKYVVRCLVHQGHTIGGLEDLSCRIVNGMIEDSGCQTLLEGKHILIV